MRAVVSTTSARRRAVRLEVDVERGHALHHRDERGRRGVRRDARRPSFSATLRDRPSVIGCSDALRTSRNRWSPSCAARLRVRSTARWSSQYGGSRRPARAPISRPAVAAPARARAARRAARSAPRPPRRARAPPPRRRGSTGRRSRATSRPRGRCRRPAGRAARCSRAARRSRRAAGAGSPRPACRAHRPSSALAEFVAAVTSARRYLTPRQIARGLPRARRPVPRSTSSRGPGRGSRVLPGPERSSPSDVEPLEVGEVLARHVRQVYVAPIRARPHLGAHKGELNGSQRLGARQRVAPPDARGAGAHCPRDLEPSHSSPRRPGLQAEAAQGQDHLLHRHRDRGRRHLDQRVLDSNGANTGRSSLPFPTLSLVVRRDDHLGELARPRRRVRRSPLRRTRRSARGT